MSKLPTRLQLVAAVVVVNVLWGSTFMAIRIGVHELPPAMFAGVRFIIAGSVLTVVARMFGQRMPITRATWVMVCITAVLMVVAGNGLVTWGEQWVPSNLAALLVTTTALWTVWFGSFGPNGERLTVLKIVGIAIGFAGAAVMFWPTDGFSLSYVWAQLAILASSFCWAIGTIYMRNQGSATGPIAFSALQMLIGGVLLCVIGVSVGEVSQWTFTSRGIGALAYLTVFGSCVAYTTYIYLIKYARPSTLGTIAYTVPLVATLFGWLLMDEVLRAPQLLGMVIIVFGVVLVSVANARAKVSANA